MSGSSWRGSMGRRSAAAPSRCSTPMPKSSACTPARAPEDAVSERHCSRLSSKRRARPTGRYCVSKPAGFRRQRSGSTNNADSPLAALLPITPRCRRTASQAACSTKNRCSPSPDRGRPARMPPIRQRCKGTSRRNAPYIQPMTDPPTFAVRPSFLGIAKSDPAAAVCVAGIPYDLGTSNRPGARFGPTATRQASRMLVDGDHPIAGTAPAERDIADIGDFRIVHGDIQGTLTAIEAQAKPLRHLVALGGDHTVTLALLRALASRTGPGQQPLALVHFDAHVDTWPDSFGQRFGHGSPFYHAIEEKLIDPHRAVQVGIRSPMDKDVHTWTREKGVSILFAETVHLMGPQAVAERIREVVGDAPAYLSFDVDALDPAFAPGTGTPEIGGLFTWQAQAILRRLAGLDFRGMDVVEVSPPYDVAEITALAAATFAWEYLALLAPRS